MGHHQEPAIDVGNPAAQHGEELGSNPNPQMTGIEIGRIVPRSEAHRGDMLFELGAAERQKRADKASRPGGHSSQAGGPGPVQGPHQNGLDLIVAVVSGNDQFRSELVRLTVEPVIASDSGFGLARGRPEPQAGGPKPDSVALRDCLHLSGDARALRVNAVIQVSDVEGEVGTRPRLYHQVQQGERIRAPRNREERRAFREVKELEMAFEPPTQTHCFSYGSM